MKHGILIFLAVLSAILMVGTGLQPAVLGENVRTIDTITFDYPRADNTDWMDGNATFDDTQRGYDYARASTNPNPNAIMLKEKAQWERIPLNMLPDEIVWNKIYKNPWQEWALLTTIGLEVYRYKYDTETIEHYFSSSFQINDIEWFWQTYNGVRNEYLIYVGEGTPHKFFYDSYDLDKGMDHSGDPFWGPAEYDLLIQDVAWKQRATARDDGWDWNYIYKHTYIQNAIACRSYNESNSPAVIVGDNQTVSYIVDNELYIVNQPWAASCAPWLWEKYYKFLADIESGKSTKESWYEVLVINMDVNKAAGETLFPAEAMWWMIYNGVQLYDYTLQFWNALIEVVDIILMIILLVCLLIMTFGTTAPVAGAGMGSAAGGESAAAKESTKTVAKNVAKKASGEAGAKEVGLEAGKSLSSVDDVAIAMAENPTDDAAVQSLHDVKNLNPNGVTNANSGITGTSMRLPVSEIQASANVGSEVRAAGSGAVDLSNSAKSVAQRIAQANAMNPSDELSSLDAYMAQQQAASQQLQAEAEQLFRASANPANQVDDIALRGQQLSQQGAQIEAGASQVGAGSSNAEVKALSEEVKAQGKELAAQGSRITRVANALKSLTHKPSTGVLASATARKTIVKGIGTLVLGLIIEETLISFEEAFSNIYWRDYNNYIDKFTDVAWIDGNSVLISGDAGFYIWNRSQSPGYGGIENKQIALNDGWWESCPSWFMHGPDANKELTYKDLHKQSVGMLSAPLRVQGNISHYFTTLIEKDKWTGNYNIYGNNGAFMYDRTYGTYKDGSFTGGICGRDWQDSVDLAGEDCDFTYKPPKDNLFWIKDMDQSSKTGQHFATFLYTGDLPHQKVGDILKREGNQWKFINTGADYAVSSFKFYTDKNGYECGLACAGFGLYKYTTQVMELEGDFLSRQYDTVIDTHEISSVKLTWTQDLRGVGTVQAFYTVREADGWAPIDNGVTRLTELDFPRDERPKTHLRYKFHLKGDGHVTPFVDDIALTYSYWGPPQIDITGVENMNATAAALSDDKPTLDPIRFTATLGINAVPGAETDPIQNMDIGWNFSDPWCVKGENNTINGTQLTAIHAFQYGGRYDVKLEARLIRHPELYTAKHVIVQIKNRPPVAKMQIGNFPIENVVPGLYPDQEVTIDGTSSYDSDGDRGIRGYTFYNGRYAEDNTVGTFSAKYTQVGTYDLRMTVRDGGDYDNTHWATDEASSTVKVYAHNIPPEPYIMDVNDTRVQFGHTMTFDGSKSQDGIGDCMLGGHYKDLIVQAHWVIKDAETNITVWEQNHTKAADALFYKYSITPTIAQAGKYYDVYLKVKDDDDEDDDGSANPAWSEAPAGQNGFCKMLRIYVSYFPESGDFHFTSSMGALEIANIYAELVGNLYFDAGSRVTFSGCDILFNAYQHNSYMMQVESGAELKIYNRTTIRGMYKENPGSPSSPSQPADIKNFLFKNYGTVDLQNSTVRNCGSSLGSGSDFNNAAVTGLSCYAGSSFVMKNSKLEDNQFTGLAVRTRNKVQITDSVIQNNKGYLYQQSDEQGCALFSAKNTEVVLIGTTLLNNFYGLRTYGAVKVLNSAVYESEYTGVVCAQGDLYMSGCEIKTFHKGIEARTCDVTIEDTTICGSGGSDNDLYSSTCYSTTNTANERSEFDNLTIVNGRIGMELTSGSAEITLRGVDIQLCTEDFWLAQGAKVHLYQYVRAFVTLNGEPYKGAYVWFYDDGVIVNTVNITTGPDGFTKYVLVHDGDYVRGVSGAVKQDIKNSISAKCTKGEINNLEYDPETVKDVPVPMKAYEIKEPKKPTGFGVMSTIEDWLPDSVLWVLIMAMILVLTGLGAAILYYQRMPKYIPLLILWAAVLEAGIIFITKGMVWESIILGIGAVCLGAITLWSVGIIGGKSGLMKSKSVFGGTSSSKANDGKTYKPVQGTTTGSTGAATSKPAR